jgi:hypothetical protein
VALPKHTRQLRHMAKSLPGVLAANSVTGWVFVHLVQQRSIVLKLERSRRPSESIDGIDVWRSAEVSGSSESVLRLRESASGGAPEDSRLKESPSVVGKNSRVSTLVLKEKEHACAERRSATQACSMC